MMKSIKSPKHGQLLENFPSSEMAFKWKRVDLD